MLRIQLESDPARALTLAVECLASRGSDPLAPTIVVADQLGIAAAVSQGLARRCGVAANLRFELPARFVWRMVARRVGGTAPVSPFDAATARWALLDALSGLPTEPAFDALRARVEAADGRERMRIATRLAHLYERLLGWRRDWLDRWAAGERIDARRAPPAARIALGAHEPWQAWLWRALLQRLTGHAREHPFAAYAAQMRRRRPDQRELPLHAGDPGRALVFGLVTLAPEQLQMLGLLATEFPIDWIAPDPSREFWEHLVSPKQAAAIAAEDPQASWLYPDEPAVLGAWGREHRDFLAALRALEEAGLATIDDDELRARAPCAPNDRLHALQASIFSLSDSPWCELPMPDAGDASLEIHSAHGLARQIEVAHDRVCAAFDELPGLQADRVAILCTDIDAAAPLVRGIFEARADARLPVAMTGTSARADLAVRALETALGFAVRGADPVAVLDWLGSPAVRTPESLDEETLRDLRRWLEAAGAHRDDTLDIPSPTPQDATHGWRAAMERLLLGAFVGAEPAMPIGQRLPVPGPGPGAARGLDSIVAFLAALDVLRGGRTEAMQLPVSQWGSRLRAFCEQWLAGWRSGDDGCLRIREALSTLQDCARPHPGPVDLAAFAEALALHLEQGRRAVRAGGAITVAPMGALRGLPFDVIVLIGMDEGRWPRPEAAGEFDLDHLWPRFGDRRIANAARGVFLDAVLAASARLIVCHDGRNVRDDSLRNPARVVAELREYLRERLGVGEADTVPGCFVHRLQSFSLRRFAADAPLCSFDSQWQRAAQRLASAQSGGVALPALVASDAVDADATGTDATGTDATGTDVDAVVDTDPGPMGGRVIASGSAAARSALVLRPNELAAMLTEPGRAFLRDGNGIALPSSLRDRRVREPLEADDIDDAQLSARARAALRRGDSPQRVIDLLACDPGVPGGSLARVAVEPIVAAAREAIARERECLDRLGVPAHAQPWAADVRLAGTDPTVGPWDIMMRIEPLYTDADGGSVLLLDSRRARAVALLQAWSHLLVGAASIDVRLRAVIGWAKAEGRRGEEPIVLRTDALGDPGAALAEWIAQCVRSRLEPRALFVRTALAFLDRGKVLPDGDAEGFDPAALAAARERYEGGERQLGERDHDWHRAVWRDSPPALDRVLRESLPVVARAWSAARPARVNDEAAVSGATTAVAPAARRGSSSSRKRKPR